MRPTPDLTGKYVLAIDQGTTSTRAIIFDHAGNQVSVGQREHAQHFPRPGWVEHDAVEIWQNVRQVVAQALSAAELNQDSIAAVGITNQRETTVVWDRRTGEPIHRAIVWQDTRTQEICKRLGRIGGGGARPPPPRPAPGAHQGPPPGARVSPRGRRRACRWRSFPSPHDHREQMLRGRATGH